MPRVAGEAFNLGGGSANAVSLIQILHEIELLTGRAVRLRHGEWRPGDQRWFVSDASKARLHLQLDEPMPWREGLADLAAWMGRSEEHSSELQSLMRISYAVFCLKKKKCSH